MATEADGPQEPRWPPELSPQDTASGLLPACPGRQLSSRSCDCSVLGHRAPT